MAVLSSNKPLQSTTATPLISLVTLCGNRLHHLRQTLPLMVQQSRTEVIVVDYNCAQGTGDWVAEHFPGVKVIRAEDSKGFCAARARNLGAAAARGKFLLFVDADIVLERDIGPWVATSARPKTFYRAHPDGGFNVWGTALCARADFIRIGGYDEAFRRWGGEDVDLYARLVAAGAVQATLPRDYVTAIEHGDEERQLKGASRSELTHSYRIYQQAKEDVTKLVGQLPDLQTRSSLLELIIEKVIRFAKIGGQKPVHIELIVNQGVKGSRHINLKRSLVYTLERMEQAVEQSTSSAEVN
jgi:hypothetical protein